jgi:hypothetical protein
MTTISFARHQFPPDIIRHAAWLYLRFTLSFRDVEDLLAERGLDVSYETVRRWVLKFWPLFARELRRRRHRPTSQWHLDEMAPTARDAGADPLAPFGACPSRPLPASMSLPAADRLIGGSSVSQRREERKNPGVVVELGGFEPLSFAV